MITVRLTFLCPFFFSVSFPDNILKYMLSLKMELDPFKSFSAIDFTLQIKFKPFCAPSPLPDACRQVIFLVASWAAFKSSGFRPMWQLSAKVQRKLTLFPLLQDSTIISASWPVYQVVASTDVAKEGFGTVELLPVLTVLFRHGLVTWLRAHYGQNLNELSL